KNSIEGVLNFFPYVPPSFVANFALSEPMFEWCFLSRVWLLAPYGGIYEKCEKNFKISCPSFTLNPLRV
ncbi:MAG: hypothetical protein OEY38_23395, partial [Gammaproteobacteria bacterium]|nr:hypothetical protein [Gammaproteobacteria bacterium]